MGEASAIGQVPWEVPEFGIDEDTLDLLRAHLEAREPFRDLPVQWLGVPGQVRHFLMSGEPRQPAHAVFSGYWRGAMSRIVAREHLQATESRYLSCSPASHAAGAARAGQGARRQPGGAGNVRLPDLQSLLGQTCWRCTRAATPENGRAAASRRCTR